jgi:hypothetical protein
VRGELSKPRLQATSILSMSGLTFLPTESFGLSSTQRSMTSSDNGFGFLMGHSALRDNPAGREVPKHKERKAA